MEPLIIGTDINARTDTFIEHNTYTCRTHARK